MESPPSASRSVDVSLSLTARVELGLKRSWVKVLVLGPGNMALTVTRASADQVGGEGTQDRVGPLQRHWCSDKKGNLDTAMPTGRASCDRYSGLW